MRRRGSEGWVLGVLLAVFVVAAVYYGERGFENQQTAQPTTYSVDPGGLRAYYQLLQQRDLHVDRFERPFTRLPPGGGLLVVAEPLERSAAKEETDALWAWVRRGGSLLVIASSRPASDADGTLPIDDIEAINGKGQPGTVQINPHDVPLLRDVDDLSIPPGTRLVDEGQSDNRTVLASDAAGAAAITWREEGGGRVLVVSDALGPANGRLRDADNALLFVNAAEELSGPGRTVLFDEYHQGFGSESASGQSLWDALGAPVRAAFWYLVVVLAIIVYNGNRRFGSAQQLRPPSSRPSTDYISSMAGLFRRAKAPELAVETIYRTFIRDLAVRVDAPLDADSAAVAGLAAHRFGWNQKALDQVVKRCEAVLAGERLSEADALGVAQHIQRWRREAELDRLEASGAPTRGVQRTAQHGG